MQGALLNIFGTGVIVTEPTERNIGNARYYSVKLGQYPPEDSRRDRDLIWADLKFRDQQKAPQKGDAIMISSGTYDIGMKRKDDGTTQRFNTVTVYVWRILPSESRFVVSESNTEPSTQQPKPSAPAPQKESAATPPPEIPDSSDIPF